MQTIPIKVKQIKSEFNYSAIWIFLQDKGIELFGKDFKLFPEDTELILKLVSWFVRDTTVAKEAAIDLDKGILLTGPVGCGKTALMSVCRFLLPADQRHTIKACRDISFDFMKDGHEIFHKYTKGSFRNEKFEPKTFCFDDLGLESAMNFYGNECSVMAEILLSRYDFFHSFGMVTHITTNLNSAEIQNRYGLRVRSRMREMFNLVSFDQNASDKRR